MPILSLNELERVEAGPAHTAFGMCGPGCGCRSCMGDLTADLANGGLSPADVSYVYSACAADYLRANPNASNADLVAYCKSNLPYGPGFQAKLTSLNLGPAAAIDNSNLIVKLQFTIGQLNLDLFGQLLKNYANMLTADERTLLQNLFTNWNQSLSAKDISVVIGIMQRLASQGASLTPSPAVVKALSDLQTQLPPSAGLIQSTPDPVAFYNQVLQSLHTISTTVANTQANNYLPAPGGSVPIPNSQGLTATDWGGAQANQAVVTDLKNATYTSPLHTLYLPQSTQNAAASSIPSPAPTSQPVSMPVMIGMALLGWVLLKGE